MDELKELRARMVHANDTLLENARKFWEFDDYESYKRVHAKAEGVRLAISYLDEYLRTSEELYADYGK